MDEVISNKNGRLRKDKFVYLCNETQIMLQKESLIFMRKSTGRICAAGVTGSLLRRKHCNAKICLELLYSTVLPENDQHHGLGCVE